MNAPPPLKPPSATELGIREEKRKLADVLPIDNWLSESFAFRCEQALLGQCTNFHEKLSYWENSINTPGVQRLADLHGYLIDAAKGGYLFNDRDFKSFLTNPANKISTTHLPIPAYKAAMEDGTIAAGTLKPLQRSPEKPAREVSNPNLDNVVDNLFFTVIDPHITCTLKELQLTLQSHQHSWDDTLLAPLKDERDWYQSDITIQGELDSLVQSVESIHCHWNKRFQSVRNVVSSGTTFEDPDLYNEVLKECYTRFQALEPTALDHPIVRRWTLERIKAGMPRWSLIKAATLFKLFHEKSTFTFHIAGRELAFIKALSSDRPRVLVEPMWAQTKPRKPKAGQFGAATGIEALKMADDHSWKTDSTEKSWKRDGEEVDYESETDTEDDFYSLVSSQFLDAPDD
jgi:RNA dependent RNA polymerase